MEIKLVGNSIVVINTGIVPSSFNSYWLVKNNILEEDELSNEHIFTNQVVELNGDDYKMIINANSFVISSKGELVETGGVIVDRLNKIIEATTNTINISSGINYNWLVDSDKESFKSLSKKLFFKDNSKLFQAFDTEDASFGSYMSKDFKGARLKLDIKPGHFKNNLGERKGSILFNFNFHFDIPEGDRRESLKTFISKWGLYYKESKKLIEQIND